MAFNMFPYSNLHRLNTDWVLEQIRNAAQAVQDAKEEVDAAVAVMEGYDEHLSILDQGVASNAGQIQTVASNLSTLAGTVATQGDRINSINTGLTDLAGHAVQTYEQEFSDAEKAQARTNIGAVALSAYNTNNNRVNAILEYQGNQISALELSDTTQAGQISALQADTASVVKYTTQTLTNAQKLQARQNIGAAASGDTPGQGSLVANIIYNAQTGYSLDGMTIAEIISALNDEFSPVTIVAVLDGSSDVLAFTNLRSEEFTSGGNTYNLITGYAISDDQIYKLTISSQTEAVTFESQPLRLPVKEVVQGSTVTLAATRDHYYSCGTLDSLTVTVSGTSGAWSLSFTSGATPTVTSIPSTILGLESFAAEANTVYEINVLDNRAVVGSWAVNA